MSADVAAAPMTPPERLLRDDMAGGDFAAGADRGYWHVHTLQWPAAIIEIAAAPRAGSPDRYAFRFDLTGYPEAPTAQPWDIAADAPLTPADWPGGSERTLRAFNPAWNPNALYLPVDRLALNGHDTWRVMPGSLAWDSAGDITQYVRLVHELLNEECYSGVRG